MKLESAVLRAEICDVRLREAMPGVALPRPRRAPIARNDFMTEHDASAHESNQLLHLVFGGELTNLDSFQFRDPAKIDIVGIFPNYDSAERAWRAKAHATVDSAQTRYFIVHLHRLLEPTGLRRKLA